MAAMSVLSQSNISQSEIFICLDPSNLNKATIQEPCYYRTIDDVLPELHATKYFMIIDMKHEFWQVTLDQASSLLATFNTHYGRFCFTRLVFGLNVAGNACQWKLDNVYSLVFKELLE